MKTEADNTANSLRLQHLLDEQVVLGILRDHVFSTRKTLGQPSDVRIERYWPGRNKSLSIEWSFCLDQDQRFSLFGQALPKGDTPQQSKPTDPEPSMIDQTLLGISVYVADWHLIIHSPDCDVQLNQLESCLNLSPQNKNIFTTIHQPNNRNGNGSLNGKGQHTPHTTCSLMGYRAGRRAALHYSFVHKDGSTEDLFFKMYRDDRGHQLIRRHGQISDQLRMLTHGQVDVPEPIRYDAQLRMAQFNWTLGQCLSMDSPIFSTQLHLAAQALAVFHSIELDDLNTFTHEDEWQIVIRWMALSNTIAPQHQQQLESLSTMLHEASARINQDDLTTIHRDYYPAQLLIDGQHVTILDLDTIAKGHKCVDIGNFLAHLLLELTNKKSSPDTWAAQCHSFIRSYQAQGGNCDQQALAYYLSSSLIRIGMVHLRRQHGEFIAETLWGTARQLLSDPHSMLMMDDTDPHVQHNHAAKDAGELK